MATPSAHVVNSGSPGRLSWWRRGVLLAALFAPWSAGAADSDAAPAPGEVLERLQAAYARHEQYQCEIEVREYSDGRPGGNRRFRYSFRKPDRIRLEMITPFRGTVLVYPDRRGKVLVRPGGGAFALHLSPGNPLIKGSGGQRLDQTGLGQLVANIGRSLNEWRRGPARVERQGGRVLLEVLSRDHFDPAAVTLYRFYLDPVGWLPVEIEEFTADRVPKRTTVFRDLHAAELPPDFFEAT